MQDKSYAVAIVVVLGICCLGMYVAVSGYLNSNPSAMNVLTTPVVQSTQVVINLATDTPSPTKPIPTQPFVATIAPVPSPLGAFQTITAATTAGAPTLLPVTPKLTVAPAVTIGPATVSCAGFLYCSKNGPADATLAPTGAECPRNYIWGRVVDATGKGMPDVRIRYKAPTGDITDALTKNLPDPQGVYNIPTGPSGSTWQIWISESAADVSPRVTLTTQPYSGAGDCPTRLDFVRQR